MTRDKTTTPIRRLAARLRKAGFRKKSYIRHQDGNILVYQRDHAELGRRLDVQLWQDGHHRVSHWHHGVTEYGIMDTTPTDFQTAEQMDAAIERELKRKR